MPPSNGDLGRLRTCGVLVLAGLSSVVVGLVMSTASSGVEARLGLLLAVVGARLSVSAWRRRNLAARSDRRDGSVDFLLSSLLLVVGLAGLAVERSSAAAVGLEVLMVAYSLPLLLAELRSARLKRDVPDPSMSSRTNLPASCGAGEALALSTRGDRPAPR